MSNKINNSNPKPIPNPIPNPNPNPKSTPKIIIFVFKNKIYFCCAAAIFNIFLGEEGNKKKIKTNSLIIRRKRNIKNKVN